jgi:hypothetical protein
MWDPVWSPLRPQPWHCNITRTQVYPQTPKCTPNLQRHITVRVASYAHTQHIKATKHFVYIQYRDVGSSLKPVAASTNTTSQAQVYPKPLNSSPTCRGISHITVRRVASYTHTKHIKVTKHFVYTIQYGCGIQSEASFGLDHDIATSHRLRCTPKMQNHIIRPGPVEANHSKGGLICPYTAYQGNKTLCIHPIWMWDPVWSLLQPQPWHYSITRAQVYPQTPKSTPDLQRHITVKGGPICPPYTAYQGNKTLCIHPIWMWDQVWSLLWPQQWHYNITRAQVYPQIPPNPPPTFTGLTMWGGTHMSIRSIWRFQTTLYAYHMEAELYFMGGLSLNHYITTTYNKGSGVSQNPQNSPNLHWHNSVRVVSHMPVHSISRC